MSELFEDAITKVRQLSEGEQDALAATLYAERSGQPESLRLTAEQVEEVQAIRARLASGEEVVVSEDDMATFWRRCGL